MQHENEDDNEIAFQEHQDRLLVSRRALLSAGALAVGGLATLSVSASMLQLAESVVASQVGMPLNVDKFMAASHFLIQHRLSPGVGTRMAAILHSAIPSLDADLDAIIRVAKEKDAKLVEDFFDSLPEGSAIDTAHRIIFGWYAGVVDDSPTAEVLAYEEALMYQPTKDAVALPTYSFNGPNHWTDVDPPLSDMPDF